MANEKYFCLYKVTDISIFAKFHVNFPSHLIDFQFLLTVVLNLSFLQHEVLADVIRDVAAC